MSESASAAGDDEKRSIGMKRFLVYILIFTVVSANVSNYLNTKGYDDPLSMAVGAAVGLLAAFPIVRGYRAYSPRGSRFTLSYVLKMMVVLALLTYGIYYAVSFLFDLTTEN